MLAVQSLITVGPTLRVLGGAASLSVVVSARTAQASQITTTSIRNYHVSIVRSSDHSRSSKNDLKASRAAFTQRQILDELRASASSSNSSTSLSEAQPRPRFNATAEAALDAASGGRGGGISLGIAGLSAGGGQSWSQLKTGQKVARATVQSTRTLLILGGGALTFVLVYALTSELFAKNSPTVIYADACRRVQNSAAIANHLLTPYRFRTSPTAESGSSDFSPLNPPSVKNRRRSRSVPSVTLTDQYTGEEKMLLRFWIGAREKGEDWSILDTARYEIVEAGKWLARKVTEGGEWLGEQLGVDLGSNDAMGGEKDGTGAVATSSDSSSSAANASANNVLSRTWSSALGGITSLVRNSTEAITSTLTSAASPKTHRTSEPGTWSTGEVHAELVKDQDGTLQYRTLFVDIPNSQALMRQRVWIVRHPGDVQR
ncbi:uncharacterized protein UMAG_15073 [Mycosarcoma maydis]|uniref:Mitochondrial import inner membrane translocase subunit TIM21 n=1 Tax=Mycosarcoma maydis TaxID=5270 RepID=A0A0D1E7T0_MYCMD|nr:uncharacterized protein UMAG_15073 [Ustilago maydis 521]KIS70455.1 hypothetical protein UMAG_15073 [Ustilago maydis 521]|eukprot:XP_011388146.1 hypothetical protein UMAG_15073 [Ustilago maydis 521]